MFSDRARTSAAFGLTANLVAAVCIEKLLAFATRWVDETNENLKRAEWEANWFAAAFLMPSGAFPMDSAEIDGQAHVLL
jgi:Zn-dependent peptidase ImmA (M78 family)